MNLLSIGNSFSVDSHRYLNGIAKADGVELTTVNLDIGGCSLERHYENMRSDERAYEMHYNGTATHFRVSLSEALTNRAWDVVTLQQASFLSFNEESYFPYVTELAAYVRRLVPTAKIYVHQTWAYESGSHRLLKNYNTPDEMLSDIIKAYDKAADAIGADGMIRSGEMMLGLIQNGIPTVHLDTVHASSGLGRYALGLLWYRTLCEKCVGENTFSNFDEYVPVEHILIAKQTVGQF